MRTPDKAVQTNTTRLRPHAVPTLEGKLALIDLSAAAAVERICNAIARIGREIRAVWRNEETLRFAKTSFKVGTKQRRKRVGHGDLRVPTSWPSIFQNRNGSFNDWNEACAANAAI
jgi:hypothetical protein